MKRAREQSDDLRSNPSPERTYPERGRTIRISVISIHTRGEVLQMRRMRRRLFGKRYSQDAHGEEALQARRERHVQTIWNFVCCAPRSVKLKTFPKHFNYSYYQGSLVCKSWITFLQLLNVNMIKSIKFADFIEM